MACGYRFEVTKFEASETRSRVTIRNIGIAPIYYDAYVSINGIASKTSLKGLLPEEQRTFEIAAGGQNPQLAIECRRLVPGQKISYVADLK
jgi:hypothetical protein